MTVFRPRACPVCGRSSHRPYLKFSQCQITELNPGYRLSVIENIFSQHNKYLVYHRCNWCGLVFFPFFWPEDVLLKIYHEAIDHDASRAKIYSPRKRSELHQQASDLLYWLEKAQHKSIENITVLDYGCGWGDFLSVISALDINSYGFEQDDIKASFAKAHGLKILSNLTELTQKKPFDIIVLNSVLEHVQEVNETMQLLHQLLRPNGLLLVTVMDYRPAFMRLNQNRLIRGLAPLTKNLNPLEHVNIFNYKTLHRLLANDNFNIKATALTTHLHRTCRLPITYLNHLERWSASLIVHQPLSITVYANTMV